MKRNPIKGTVVTCGRLNEQKNHKMLIEAVEKVVQNNKDVCLHIYGDGDLKNELEQLIENKDLKGVVVLKGATTDVESVLASADIFVMSSDYEGMPNALMEALAVGVPCISTDCPCGGPRMLIKEGENGCLVPVNDSVQMANVLEKLLINQDFKYKLGEKARERALEYRPEKIFREWLDFIIGIVNSEQKGHKYEETINQN